MTSTPHQNQNPLELCIQNTATTCHALEHRGDEGAINHIPEIIKAIKANADRLEYAIGYSRIGQHDRATRFFRAIVNDPAFKKSINPDLNDAYMSYTLSADRGSFTAALKALSLQYTDETQKKIVDYLDFFEQLTDGDLLKLL